MIVIVDYHVGNLKSVLNSCKKEGMEVLVSGDKQTIMEADALILPGVGTFKAAMQHLEECDLIDTLKAFKQTGKKILGICLGMQICFELGEEVELIEGLSFLEGKVQWIETDLKLPHMGWNELYFHQKHDLTKYLLAQEDVYFVHSYKANCTQDEVIAYAKYGDQMIPAIVGKENVMGCQFHPEKSGEVGSRILRAFKEMVE